MVKPRWKTAWRFLETLNIEVPYDPAIPFLSVGAEKITIQNDTCTLIFRVALFTIVKTTESIKMSIDRKMKTTWYIYTLKCYLAIKQNKIMTLAAAWIYQEIIILYILFREKRTNILRYHVQWNL